MEAPRQQRTEKRERGEREAGASARRQGPQPAPATSGTPGAQCEVCRNPAAGTASIGAVSGRGQQAPQPQKLQSRHQRLPCRGLRAPRRQSPTPRAPEAASTPEACTEARATSQEAAPEPGPRHSGCREASGQAWVAQEPPAKPGTPGGPPPGTYVGEEARASVSPSRGPWATAHTVAHSVSGAGAGPGPIPWQPCPARWHESGHVQSLWKQTRDGLDSHAPGPWTLSGLRPACSAPHTCTKHVPVTAPTGPRPARGSSPASSSKDQPFRPGLDLFPGISC